MAIKPFTPSAPISATPAPKKKGSGFVSFDKAAEQNRQASYALGDKIQSNLGQQVQAVQGQVQNEQQSVQNQLGAEQARLGQVGTVAQGIQGNPVAVDKAQYKDLTSGTAKQADTKGIQQLQGSLGSTAQVAQQFSSNPFARQQAIQDTVKRPAAMQNLMGVQRNLDSMLLGRNVNTQDLATKTARDAFNVDRLVGSTVKQAGETGQALQSQAQSARDLLRTSRQGAVEGINKAGIGQANTYNEQQGNLAKYVNEGGFFKDLEGSTETTDPNFNKVLETLKAGGLDLASQNLDLTEMGREGFEGTVKANFQKGLADSMQALTEDQKARLRALRTLEDESISDLDNLKAAEAKFVGSENLLKASGEAATRTAEYDKKVNDIVSTLTSRLGDRPVDTEVARLIGTDIDTLRGASGNQVLKDALLRGGRDFGFYDNSIDEVFQQLHTGGWGAARGQTLEDIQRSANRTPINFSSIYKRNLKG
jgi:hypothetical protein